MEKNGTVFRLVLDFCNFTIILYYLNFISCNSKKVHKFILNIYMYLINKNDNYYFYKLINEYNLHTDITIKRIDPRNIGKLYPT